MDAPSEVAPPQLVTVPGPSKAAAKKLAALELDVTHNVRSDRADVVVYTAAERRKLEDAGFTVTTKVADLPAFDRRARTRDRRSEERRVGKECRSRWSP